MKASSSTTSTCTVGKSTTVEHLTRPYLGYLWLTQHGDLYFLKGSVRLLRQGVSAAGAELEGGDLLERCDEAPLPVLEDASPDLGRGGSRIADDAVSGQVPGEPRRRHRGRWPVLSPKRLAADSPSASARPIVHQRSVEGEHHGGLHVVRVGAVLAVGTAHRLGQPRCEAMMRNTINPGLEPDVTGDDVQERDVAPVPVDKDEPAEPGGGQRIARRRGRRQARCRSTASRSLGNLRARPSVRS